MDNSIEVIPKTMEKFLGYKGKMLKPSPDTVEALVGKIRKGKIVTILQLRERLAKDFKVSTACPAATMKALQVISGKKQPKCYWRVVKPEGELISKFPGGVKGHGERLENEGFQIDRSKRNPIVLDYENKLAKLM